MHSQYFSFVFVFAGWWQYDERTCQEIEEAYKKEEKFCTILVAGYVYVVDFETMLQQRQNEPTRKRQVKRDLATTPKKGVAGLRFDGTAELDSSYSNSTSGSSTGAESGTLSPLPMAVHDEAIRIAGDIIHSTLAHADDSRSDTNESNDSSSSGHSSTLNRRDLLNAVEETLNMTSSLANISISGPNLDFFSSGIIDSLALTNIAESSSDDDDDSDVVQNVFSN